MTLNGLPSALKHETVWLDSYRYQEVEQQYHEMQAKRIIDTCVMRKEPEKSSTQPASKSLEGVPKSSIAIEIANAREKIKNMLSGDSVMEVSSSNIIERLQKLEETNKSMSERLSEMTLKIKSLEQILSGVTLSETSKKDTNQSSKTQVVNQNGPAEVDDDDIDLFGSDEETEEDARIREERLKAYENKKAKKPALVAKSSVVLDVKPWDDETDMKALEVAVRKISSNGLKWGASKLVPLAYGIKKLQIIAIVEDDEVSIDWLQETIQENEDLVQSVDIAAFNKL